MKDELLKNLKILIVEDELKLSKLLKEAISDHFYSVTVANDGIEGIKKFELVRPDIVITDIMMPKLDGLEMTKKLKSLDENLPIIVLSAFSDKDKLLKAIDVGINKYFIKPFDPDELIEYISDLALKLNKKRIIRLKDHFLFDNNRQSLYEDGKIINLTKREKDFLMLLIDNKNTIVKNAKIKSELWDEPDISDERVRTFIKRFRVKTSKDLIENASGQGYLIEF